MPISVSFRAATLDSLIDTRAAASRQMRRGRSHSLVTNSFALLSGVVPLVGRQGLLSHVGHGRDAQHVQALPP
jgi:hypothetical protein